MVYRTIRHTSAMLDVVTQPRVEVLEAEYTRLLGYPPHHRMEGRARELADWARDWYDRHGSPWCFTRRAAELQVSDEGVRLDGALFRSPRLREQLEEGRASGAMLVAVSAGEACETTARQLWEEGKPDEYFFLEVFGSAVVEHLVTTTGARLCEWADGQGMAMLPHYSPGYPGWDIAEQQALWDLIQPGDGTLPELEVLDSGMLKPKKSLLAVFGVSEEVGRLRRLTDLVPCQNCALPACRYRRAPYRRARGSLESVSGLQPRTRKNGVQAGSERTALNHEAAYSLSLKALRKWSEERLQIQVLADRTVEARFRYEGTTCSNMGRPLAYDYRVSLAGPQDGYRIRSASCAPAPGDTGHTHMCKYQKDPGSLAAAIENEKPLLGEPLEAVLTWERRFSPTGCYCDTASRMHKWGITLEVIHYALVQHERNLLRENGAPR
jgi:hypothetical protein